MARIKRKETRSQEFYRKALSEYGGRYGQAMGEIYQAKETAAKPISSAYGQLVGLFESEGGYGAGQRALIEEERKRNIASAFGQAIQSGMWSGTMAAGAQQRAGRYATQQLLGVEDIRIEKLAQSLEAMGAAEEARTLRMTQAGLTGAQTIGQLAAAAPTYSQYYDPGETARYTAGMQYLTQKMLADKKAEEAERERQFETEQERRFQYKVY